MNQLAPLACTHALPALIAAAREHRHRFLAFFAARIRNPHRRRAYALGVGKDLCVLINGDPDKNLRSYRSAVRRYVELREDTVDPS
jgi:hypothetical protein